MSERMSLAVRCLGLLCAGAVTLLVSLTGCQRAATPPATGPGEVRIASEPVEATDKEVKEFCGYCHRFPLPETFPRRLWHEEVEQGYDFHLRTPRGTKPPVQDQIVTYYRNRAPEELPLLPPTPPGTLKSVRFEKAAIEPPAPNPTPAISNIRLVPWGKERKLAALACDMLRGEIYLIDLQATPPVTRLLSKDVPHPAHVEVVDLDGDGHDDLLVADLGSFFPSDHKLGQVVWLRGGPDGKFTPHVLLRNVGRVADVQAGDFNGDGKLDLAVAVFGWRQSGAVLYLENRTTDWNRPNFVSHVLDTRNGAIHVPVVDLNQDGKLDFVALISQEHETVVAYLGDGKGGFVPKTIFEGEHPALGSSGIQLVDLDKDGRMDVLLANGDTLDRKLLRPYHGIRWLRNTGTFPFESRTLAAMYGVHRALAADFDGDGDLDILAVSLLPEPGYSDLRRKHTTDAIILLEQTTPGTFVRHVLESVTCDHATADIGDIDGDGRIDFITGAFSLIGAYQARGERAAAPTSKEWVSVWRNRPPASSR